MAKPSPDPAKYDPSVRFFRDRTPISDAEFRQLDAKAKQTAFTVGEVAQLDLVTQVWEAIDDAITNGTGLEEFKAAVGDSLAAAWGVEQPWRLETIFRTNVQQAYSNGRWAQLNDPDVKQYRPYWKFTAILDGRTTQICEQCGGTTLPADDPWWQSHNPPLHFNCRSGIISLSESEATRLGVDDSGPKVAAQGDFGVPPEEQDFRPDLSEYPTALVQIFKAG